MASVHSARKPTDHPPVEIALGIPVAKFERSQDIDSLCVEEYRQGPRSVGEHEFPRKHSCNVVDTVVENYLPADRTRVCTEALAPESAADEDASALPRLAFALVEVASQQRRSP